MKPIGHLCTCAFVFHQPSLQPKKVMASYAVLSAVMFMVFSITDLLGPLRLGFAREALACQPLAMRL